MKGLEIIPTYHLPPFTSPSTQNYKQNPSKRILFDQFNSLNRKFLYTGTYNHQYC